MLCASQKIFMILAASAAAAFLWRTPSFAADPARLAVKGAERPVELSELAIKAEVGGGYAWTTVEMTFHNPNSRALEGELQFPLADGQTITGFALSMGEGKNEIMRDAVPVEKQKGRQTFESIERRKVDPALLEAARGNNFKLRVYPLPPGGDRRVRLTYFERLSENGGGVLYRLPLSYGGASGNLSVNVAISGAGGEPSVQGGVLGGLVPDVKRAGAGEWSVSLSGKDVPLDGVILPLSIPDALKDGVYLGEHGGKTYFHALVPIPPGAKRQLPKSVSILWDASMSGKNRNHKLELDFLDKFFSDAKDVSVDLRQVRDAADKKTEFDVRGGDWSALRKTLESVIYDGATNLGAFDMKTSADMYFLFSDGLDNYSVSPMAEPDKPLYAFLSAPGADLPRLRALAGGGDVIDLTMTDAGRAVGSVGEVRPRLAAVEGAGVSDVLWRFDGTNSYIVSGMVSDPNRPVAVAFDMPDGQRVTQDIDIASRVAAKRIGGVPFLWASMKIEALEAEYDLNKGEIRRLGKSFGIATRETSLIVLESAADYVTYGIDPPSDLKAEYDRLRPSAQFTGERNKMERVLREWRERDEWWNKDFPKGTMPKSDAKSAPVAGPVRLSSVKPVWRSVPYTKGIDSEGNPEVGYALSNGEGWRASGNGAPSPVSKSQPLDEGMIIFLRPWSPDEPYIRRMKDAKDGDLYRVYLDERPDYENSVSFYLDVAYQLRERGQTELSLRVLSNLAEMELENRQILRVLGYRLLEAGMNDTAVAIFRRVLAIADDEPQSCRDLALALNAAGNYQEAIERLYDVAERSFERNFPGIEVICLTEMNAIIANAPVKPDTSGIDPRFITNRPLDLRVVLTWDSDNTDIDLHVTDPNGEEAFYSHPLSYQGGRVSPDNTEGYGPEEYSLKIAKPGKYRIEVNFYGHTQQVISESTAIQLDFFTHYGAPNQEKQSVTMRLKEAKDRIFVGEFEVR
ncbi:MAG: DUF2135 domain-containing protein [Synergistaceae bacterium]|jgi:hypothetical protein|nr:DUF2135 domain-containing protein [Synergistaceae bacterium]